MKKWFILTLLIFLVVATNAYSQVIWQENFDGFSKEWACCRADCSGTPGVPPSYTEFHANTMCGGDGCNELITATAERSNPGGLNKRGLRLKFTGECFPTGENVLKKDLGVNLQVFYLRWYERNSTKNFTNFHKLFRLKQVSGQILIPEWQVNWQTGTVQMNLGELATGGNHFFTGYSLDTDYVPGTWVCYEIKIDLINKAAEFWVNGVSKGRLTSQPWTTGWYVRNVEIGGNQYGGGVGNYRDYDDIVVSTSYVGPDGGGGGSTPGTAAPNPPTGLRVY